MKRLRVFLSGHLYEMARDIDLHYHNVLFIVFCLVDLYTKVTDYTSKDRTDLLR